jgi:PGAP1-like protein
MSKKESKNFLRHLHPSDLRAVAHLATRATLSVTDVVEGVHQSVLTTLGLPGAGPGKTGGLSALVYRSVQGVTQLVGKGLDQGLASLEQLLEVDQKNRPDTRQREAVMAALNGVMGDELLKSQNSFATPMSLRYQGKILDWSAMPATNGKILLLIHGLCMNDLQWQSGEPGQEYDHGGVLAAELGYTPLYLRYNTGLHVSQNGHQLAALLEEVQQTIQKQSLEHCPAVTMEMCVIAHSMGGLLIRSAYDIAEKQGLQWPKYLKHCVFLGTPHHGAPLERVGNWVDVMLSSTRYSAPIGKLVQLRSAGITDLRYGFLLDQDWQGRNRFQRQPDERQHVPLPAKVSCYAVAAMIGNRRNALAERLTGDGLVPLRSALGEHDDPQRCLHFAPEHSLIVHQVNHMALLSDSGITQQMLKWLSS